MANALKIISVLLSYPSADLQAAIPEIEAAIADDTRLAATERARLAALANNIGGLDLYDAQERYVSLFDRTRTLSLHLFEHVHGESRDRGQAMVDLIKVYEDGGFTPTTKELPDFLPLFLEYAATRAPAEALELIGQPGHVFAALRERLAKRSSPYEAIFASLTALSRTRLNATALAALRAEADPEPDDLEALDAAWEEEEVTFGPGSAAAACGTDVLAAKLRQANRPAPGMEPPPGQRPRTTITHRNAG